VDPRNKIVIQKFGGSSVATPELIRSVAARICDAAETGAGVVATVSAMGDTTDDLIALSRDVVGDTGPANPRELDTLLSTGELASAALMAMAINARGQKAISLSGIQAGVKTDAQHGSARIAEIDTSRIREELDSGRIVIVAGFQGLSVSDDVTTLGRGASDLTAVALAAALGAERCEIYTDVDGIYTTDPRFVPDARKLNSIGYEEMLELASLGAKMNPRSIELASVYGVPVLVASSSEDLPGTMIEGERLPGSQTMEVRNAVTAVEVETGVAEVAVRGIANRKGLAAEVFELVAEQGVNVDVILANDLVGGSASDLVFTVDLSDLDTAARAVRSMAGADAETYDNLSKVSIVGTGMLNTPGYGARMFQSLSEAGVNIHLVASSEVRITCVVDGGSADAAAEALAREFSAPRIIAAPADSATEPAEYPISGIAIDREAARITVGGVQDRPGVAAGLFGPLAEQGIIVDIVVQTSSSEGRTDMAFTTTNDDAERAVAAIENQSVVEYDQVVVDRELSKLSIVGAGLKYTPGQAALMFRTLASEGVNIRAMTTSDIRITCLIDSALLGPAAQALHRVFRLAESR
jgi:aspartate kinase